MNDRRRALLERVWLFSSCRSRDLSYVARFVDEVRVDDGIVLSREGRRAHQVIALLDGLVSVSDSAGRSEVSAPGSTFGEAAVLANGCDAETVTTLGRSHLLVIEARVFLGLVDAVPLLGRKLLRDFARRNMASSDRGVRSELTRVWSAATPEPIPTPR